jgi:hypothetical protein
MGIQKNTRTAMKETTDNCRLLQREDMEREKYTKSAGNSTKLKEQYRNYCQYMNMELMNVRKTQK